MRGLARTPGLGGVAQPQALAPAPSTTLVEIARRGLRAGGHPRWTDQNVKGITLWGYVVGSTWLTNSGLMQSSGQMRPAMTWLMGYLNR